LEKSNQRQNQQPKDIDYPTMLCKSRVKKDTDKGQKAKWQGLAQVVAVVGTGKGKKLNIFPFYNCYTPHYMER